MNSSKIIFIFINLSLVMSACSPPASGEHPTLPFSWVDAASAHAARNEPLMKPPEETSASIGASFKAHTAAVSAVTRRAMMARPELPPPGAPKDWVPWHLDGMIAEFGVGVDGVFGALSGEGEIGLEVTWQQARRSAPALRTSRASKKKLKFNSRMSKAEVVRLIEPAVKTAIATKSIDDVGNFRKNVTREAIKFLEVTRALDSITRASGWHVAGYQLSIEVSASGSVGPSLGVGGKVQLVFEWEQSERLRAVPPGNLNPTEKILSANLASFVETMTTLIPEARANARDIRKAGFELEEFDVGLGLMVGGDIGVATVEGQAYGRVIFKKDSEPETAGPTQPVANRRPARKTMKFVGGPGGTIVSDIAVENFRSGITRAIDMSSYFAKNAIIADTDSWRVVEIQPTFECSLGGDLTIVTVGGIGLIRLSFERID